MKKLKRTNKSLVKLNALIRVIIHQEGDDTPQKMINSQEECYGALSDMDHLLSKENEN